MTTFRPDFSYFALVMTAVVLNVVLISALASVPPDRFDPGDCVLVDVSEESCWVADDS